MAKVKYKVKEYSPTGGQPGNHSFFAEVVINSDIDNVELARKIAARTGFKSYECQAVIAAIADIVAEEVLESNRVSLADERGNKMLSIYPKVNGSVSDADILKETTAAHNVDPSVPVRTVATEEDLTVDRLNFVLGSTVGIKFSKQFSMNKSAQKVKSSGSETVAENSTPSGGSNTEEIG